MKLLTLVTAIQILSIVGAFWPSTSIAEQLIRLRTDLETGYSQSLDATNIRHMETVRCILNRMNWDSEIMSSPVKRNRILTTKNEIDGFFLHSPQLLPGSLATTSNPIAIERWFMFQRKSDEKSFRNGDHAVSAVTDSNEHHWLKLHNYKKIIAAPNLNSVVKMLHRKRVSFALADQTRFWRNVFLTETPANQFSAYFIRYAPLVMYFSRQFIDGNPTFLEQFNNNIDGCVQDRLKPNIEEARHLLNIQKEILRTDDNQAKLTALIKAELRNRTLLIDGAAEDERWILAQQNGERTPLIDRIEGNPLSDFLRHLIRLGNRKINEIFVMDSDGYILGMNQTTSDYWQGDEPLYQSIMKNRQSMHISVIDFDASTQKFQIQITVPIKNPKTDQIIALMTTGFDADIALTSASEF